MCVRRKWKHLVHSISAHTNASRKLPHFGSCRQELRLSDLAALCACAEYTVASGISGLFLHGGQLRWIGTVAKCSARMTWYKKWAKS